MNHRETPPPPGAGRRALAWLLLTLLPGLTPAGPTPPTFRLTIVRTTPAESPSLPYLPVFGPPPLRFQSVEPPPDVVTRPPAAAPPVPPGKPAVQPTSNDPKLASSTPAAATKANSTATPPAAHPEPEAKPAAPILRDAVRPTVQPEDFLPYFVFPGAGADGSSAAKPIAAPAPVPAGTLPPSSATYRQTPE